MAGALMSIFGAAHAQQVSNFDIPAEVAEAYSCGLACQQTVAQFNILDLMRYRPEFDYDFYATASNFSSSQPGDILRVQPYLDSASPEGVTTYKIQYTSVGIEGQPVPATGFVALPPRRGCQRSKLVAFATGSVGFYRGCPRTHLADFYEPEGWTKALVAGYAVVATDYAGLGTNYTEHMYFTKTQANDVYYSVLAAKQAFGSLLTDEWAAFGHSQGGLAVWQLSEHELVQDPGSGYLGGVAIAPPTKLHDAYVMIMSTLRQGDPSPALVTTALAAVVPTIMFLRRAFPEYDAPLIKEVVKDRVHLADLGQLCQAASSALAFDLTLDQVFVDLERTDDPLMKKFQDLHAPAQGDPASRPLLVIQGSLDIGIAPATTKASFDAACGFGNKLHRTLYEGLEHNLIMGPTSDEWLQFIADRFAGKDFGSVCTESFVPLGKR